VCTPKKSKEGRIEDNASNERDCMREGEEKGGKGNAVM